MCGSVTWLLEKTCFQHFITKTNQYQFYLCGINNPCFTAYLCSLRVFVKFLCQLLISTFSRKYVILRLYGRLFAKCSNKYDDRHAGDALIKQTFLFYDTELSCITRNQFLTGPTIGDKGWNGVLVCVYSACVYITYMLTNLICSNHINYYLINIIAFNLIQKYGSISQSIFVIFGLLFLYYVQTLFYV